MKDWPLAMFVDLAVTVDNMSQDIAVITNPTEWIRLGKTCLFNEWLEEHNVKNIGMILSFPDKETRLLFALRWC